MHRSATGDARRVHEDVDATVLGVRRRERIGDRRFVAHVERDDRRRRRDVHPHRRRALGLEPLRRRRADPGRRAGDHRDLAVEPAHVLLSPSVRRFPDLTCALNNYIVSVQMSTSTPVRERGPDTATRILDAAELCIRRYGLRRVSMGDVAQAAGLSRGSVYNHFQDREALIDAVLERTADRFVAGSEASVRRRRTLAAQVAEAAAFIRTHQDDPLLVLTAGEESLIASLLTARIDGLVARWVEFWQPYPRRRRGARRGPRRASTGAPPPSGSSACCSHS